MSKKFLLERLLPVSVKTGRLCNTNVRFALVGLFKISDNGSCGCAAEGKEKGMQGLPAKLGMEMAGITV